MTRIHLLLTGLLAAILIVTLAESQGELKREACCAGRALPGLRAVPLPQQLWKRSAAVARTAANLSPLRDSAPAVFAGTAPGRAAKATAPVLARGWEHDNGDATVITALTVGDPQAPLALLVNPAMKDEAIICGTADVLNCGYGSSKKGPLPLNLRRSGAGIALTISKTNIWIEPHGLRFSTSVSF